VKTIAGGTGNDTITLGAAAVNASINLGSGTDVLTLGNFNNTATIGGIETITGGSLADNITLAARSPPACRSISAPARIR